MQLEVQKQPAWNMKKMKAFPPSPRPECGYRQQAALAAVKYWRAFILLLLEFTVQGQEKVWHWMKCSYTEQGKGSPLLPNTAALSMISPKAFARWIETGLNLLYGFYSVSLSWAAHPLSHLRKRWPRAPEDTDTRSTCGPAFLAVKQHLLIPYLWLVKNVGRWEANDSPVTEHRQRLLISRAGEIAQKVCRILHITAGHGHDQETVGLSRFY